MPASVSSPARFTSAATSSAPAPSRERWLALIGSWVLRLLALTLRIEVEDPAALRARVESGPFILFWHNRLLLVPVVWNRYFASHRPKGMALTSTSRDGELSAEFLNRFGIGRSAAPRPGTDQPRCANWRAG